MGDLFSVVTQMICVSHNYGGDHLQTVTQGRFVSSPDFKRGDHHVFTIQMIDVAPSPINGQTRCIMQSLDRLSAHPSLRDHMSFATHFRGVSHKPPGDHSQDVTQIGIVSHKPQGTDHSADVTQAPFVRPIPLGEKKWQRL